MGIELHHPDPHDLKRHAADLRRLCARRPVVNRSQAANSRRAWPLSFEFLASLRSSTVSQSPRSGIGIANLHRSQHRSKSSPIRESPSESRRSTGVGIRRASNVIGAHLQAALAGSNTGSKANKGVGSGLPSSPEHQIFPSSIAHPLGILEPIESFDDEPIRGDKPLDILVYM